MTSQQVNLLADDLRPRALLFSAEHALYAWLTTVVVLAALSIADAISLTALSGEGEVVKEQLRNVNDATTSIRAQISTVEDGALAEKVAALRADSERSRTLLAALEGGEVLQSKGFSGHLRDLANHGVRGLWLTGMTFDARSGSIRLEGEAEDPVFVPKFLKGLSSGSHFTGQKFAGVELFRTELGTARFAISGPDATIPGNAPL